MYHNSLLRCAVLSALSVPAGAAAQLPPTPAPACSAPVVVDLAGHESALLRSLQLQGTAPVGALTIRRPSSERMFAPCAAGADTAALPQAARSIALLPVRLRSVYNSAYPVDVNNGVLWAGRGASAAASAGIEVRFGPASAGAYPTVAVHQNREFDLAPVQRSGLSPFSYAGHVIDWPQRHGDDSFSVLDPGSSFVRLDAFGAAIGLSTENLWLGPAQRMPLLMGASAPGFAHLFLGTSRPADIRIGSLEAHAVWGRLTESDYFDGNADNRHRLLALLAVVFEPAFARGLFIGVSRAYVAAFDSGDPGGMFIDPYIDVRDNPDGDNQLLSLYARWVLPAAGFEVYGEWAREDHWATWLDLLLEPDHSQAYMLGFQKVGRFSGADLRWFGELAHLQSSATLRGGRGDVTFYTHTQLRQGYTHGGQLLGAWIGPGSDAQLLGVERVAGVRMTGITVERVRFDDDAYYAQWGHVYGQNGHDVSLGAVVRHVEPVGPFSIAASVGVARRHNRNFIRFDGSHPGDFRGETNIHIDLDLRWQPRW
jgi:hypothetical protein